MSKRNVNLKPFMVSFGICGTLAGAGLMIFGNWEGVFALLSGLFISFFGFKQKGSTK